MTTETAVYLSAVKGHLVPRFSTLTSPAGRTNIGVKRDEKGAVVYDERAVVCIPIAEFNRHRKEYHRAIDDGALKKRTREDFDAYRAEVDKADAEAEAKRKANEAKAKAEAEAAAKSKAETDAAAKAKAEADAKARAEAKANADAETKAKARKSNPKGRKPKAEAAQPEPNGAEE